MTPEITKTTNVLKFEVTLGHRKFLFTREGYGPIIMDTYGPKDGLDWDAYVGASQGEDLDAQRRAVLEFLGAQYPAVAVCLVPMETPWYGPTGPGDQSGVVPRPTVYGATGPRDPTPPVSPPTGPSGPR
jgi:hypothetical protein